MNNHCIEFALPRIAHHLLKGGAIIGRGGVCFVLVEPGEDTAHIATLLGDPFGDFALLRVERVVAAHGLSW
jgi:hypothetical protein